MAFEEVREVAGGLVIEGFVGGDEYFEIYSVFCWDPVKVMEDWGDVVSACGSGEEAGSRVLHILKFNLSPDYFKTSVVCVISPSVTFCHSVWRHLEVILTKDGGHELLHLGVDASDSVQSLCA